jgi:hypothetical protein
MRYMSGDDEVRMSGDDVLFDPSRVPHSPTGVVLCPEPCGLRMACRMGILSARPQDEGSVVFDVKCPEEYRENPNLAHASWTAGLMSEICGQLPLWIGIVAFAGTVTTRFQAPVAVGERFVVRATLEGRERRKLFVAATLTSPQTQTVLATASGISVAARQRDLDARGLS